MYEGEREERNREKGRKEGGLIPACQGSPSGPSGKEPDCQCRRHKRHGFDPWVGKIPWKRAWQPTPVFLFGESHGQRRLVGYSSWGLKESDMTKQLTLLLLLTPTLFFIYFFSKVCSLSYSSATLRTIFPIKMTLIFCQTKTSFLPRGIRRPHLGFFFPHCGQSSDSLQLHGL